MPQNLLKVSLLFMSLSLSSLAVHAESPPVSPLPTIDSGESATSYPLVNPADLPLPVEPRMDYALSLGGGRGVLISPNWALTASHVVTREKQQAPWKLKIKFKGKGSKKYTAKQVFRHPKKDLALVQLATPLLEKRKPVILMRDAIRKNQRVTVKKVSEGRAKAWKNIPAFGGSLKNLYVSKNKRRGGPGTSGSPWLIESPLVGDVVVAITHGSGRAPQVALAKDWIQSVVETYTPGETLYWASSEQVFAKASQAVPLEAINATEEQSHSTLIVLP